jgi:hypothetical protein
VDEVQNRANSRVAYDRQLEKNAAADALRRLINGSVTVDETFETEDDETTFDNVVRQLHELDVQRHGESNDPSSADKHMGEASAIVCCLREQRSGDRVVFVTNDGGASTVAAVHDVDARHFGHVMQELVCAGLFTSDKAMSTFVAANRVTSVPKSETPRSAQDFACKKAASPNCASCP